MTKQCYTTLHNSTHCNLNWTSSALWLLSINHCPVLTLSGPRMQTVVSIHNQTCKWWYTMFVERLSPLQGSFKYCAPPSDHRRTSLTCLVSIMADYIPLMRMTRKTLNWTQNRALGPSFLFQLLPLCYLDFPTSSHDHTWALVLETKVIRMFPKISQSRRRPLLGPSPGWKRLLALSHLRHY